MKILVITNDPLLNESYRSLFSSIAEGHEVAICNSIETSRNFLTGEIVGFQKDLDSIVIELNLPDGDALNFCYQLRNDYESIFSNFSFKLNSIPIILISPGRYDMERYLMFGFNHVVDETNEHEVSRLPEIVKKQALDWRRKVVDDLEYLGLNGSFEYRKAHSVNILNSRTEKTFAIAHDFVRRKKRIENNWYMPDFDSIEKSIEKLQKKLHYSNRFRNKHEEKKYHDFFRKFPHLLLRNSYDKRYFYEPRFPPRKQRENGIEPDFILKPYYDLENSLDVLELKLPNENFINSKKYHPNFLSRMINHFGQLRDYQDYFEDPLNEELVAQLLGSSPKKFNYSLLVGRREDKEVNLEIFNRRIRHFGLEDINVITYDDIIEMSAKYYLQLVELKI